MNYRNCSEFFAYWNEVKKYMLPDQAGIEEILLQRKAGENLSSEIVLGTLKYVCGIVYRWRYLKNADLMDLIGAGNLGILKGLPKYNPSRAKFVDFIMHYIKSYVYLEIERMYPYSRSEKKKRLSAGLDTYPTVSLNLIVSENSEGEQPLLLQDTLPSKTDEDALKTIDINTMLTALRNDRNKPHRLAPEVIDLRFGLLSRKGWGPKSLSQTASVLHVSKETVRNIEQKTLSYLRAG